jgi:hypothetical protein
MTERPVKLATRGGRSVWITPSKVNAISPAIPAPGDMTDNDCRPLPYSCVDLDCGDSFFILGDIDLLAGLLFPDNRAT